MLTRNDRPWRIWLLIWLASGCLALSLPARVHAQAGGVDTDAGETILTNPKTRQRTVTATVPDNLPPSTPVLISPTNNSYVTVNKPTFVWEQSTDSDGIGSYQLAIDGSNVFTGIPTTATENANYTLTYDSGTGRYSLATKIALSEGIHTWKIRALDTSGNGTDSATWTFTVDTQAPSFVLTQLGTATVSISAQDISTIPATPVQLSANEPLLVATGEANSSVSVIVTIPGDPTQNYTVAIDGGSNWSQQLGILPRDVIMTLDFTITDVAGNVSVLTGVQFIIPTDVIVYPPASPSPSPEATPDASATPTPTSSPAPSPAITIPLLPPREIIHEVTQETGERLAPLIDVLTQAVPEGVRQTISNTAQALAPVSAAVVSSAIPIASTIAVASQFGWGISPDLLLKILQALGLLPVGKAQGMVFDSSTYEPIPFALLTITSQDEAHSIHETVVTDVNGIYRGFKLPPGKYALTVTHQEYTFPTLKSRPAYLALSDYYRGEVFTVSAQSEEQLFLIPMDKNTQVTTKRWRARVRLFLARVAKLTTHLVLPLFFISGLLAVVFPTIWNWSIFGFYCLLVLNKTRNWFKTPLLTGTVIDDAGQPVANAIIRLALPETNELVRVLRSDTRGVFVIFAPQDTYQLSISKDGYIWFDQNAPLSLYEIKPGPVNQKLVVTMKSAAGIYDELFGAVK